MKKVRFRSAYQYIPIIILLSIFSSCKKSVDFTGYVYVYFTGSDAGEEEIHYAISEDGFHYRALNNNTPVLDSKNYTSSGGARDPYILRAEDGKTFYMVVTDLKVSDMGWENSSIVLMKSSDLINWEKSVVNMPAKFPKEYGQVNRVWSPQVIYDKHAGKYMVYFSMRKNQDVDILYYAYVNNAFTDLDSKPEQLYVSPSNNACIDADIIEKDNKFYMYFKSEDGKPGVKLAISDFINKDYRQLESGRVDKGVNYVEGASIFKLNHSDGYMMLYDAYGKDKIEFASSKDLIHFQKVSDDKISMNFKPKQGCVLPVTDEEILNLVKNYGSFKDPLIEFSSPELKRLNVNFDKISKKIHFPVKSGTDLSAYDPGFVCWKGYKVSPTGKQDFTKGEIDYEISIQGKGSEKYKVTASIDHNPVIEGYYADPDIIYSNKTGKYYIYPTTDGYLGWSSTQLKVFSSADLIHWTDEGVIIDLHKDVSWAENNAWSPSVVEKKINGKYKYLIYYTAEQKIGVAIADNPTGPFADAGNPLVTEQPEGIDYGQQIDPDVFTDSQTGKSYLFWGNMYLACAELNNDMLSIKKNTLKVITPDATYRGGVEVVYRKGKYYFLWSENDTRSPNYRVRYAIANAPSGNFTIPENNIVIEKNINNGIYGTGNCSVLQIKDSDEWVISYHRFTVPEGIKMGSLAGYYREVCLDELKFNEKGEIVKVEPTLKGVVLGSLGQ